MNIVRLTERQELACREFVGCGCKSEAYRRAYSVAEGVDPQTVAKRAGELFAKPHVQARLEQLRADALARAEITADWVVERIAAIARTSLLDVVELEGEIIVESPGGGRIRIKDGQSLTRSQRAAIRKITVNKQGITVEVQDKMPALSELLRWVKPEAAERTAPVVQFNIGDISPEPEPGE